MKLVCLMPCRNEDWIIGLSARAALMWCDHLVVLDHASTDDTQAIIYDLMGEYPGRIIYERVEGEWLEIAGMGLVRKEILENSRTGGKEAWAFGMGLERLAMILFKIPDIRYFWSEDPRFTDQFKDGKIETVHGSPRSSGGRSPHSTRRGARRHAPRCKHDCKPQ